MKNNTRKLPEDNLENIFMVVGRQRLLKHVTQVTNHKGLKMINWTTLKVRIHVHPNIPLREKSKP